MAFLDQCEKRYEDDMQECRRYFCNYTKLASQDLSSGNLYPTYGDATKCHMEYVPKYKPKECPSCPVGDPIVYDGVPVDWEMQSFFQPFEICSNPRDRGNEFIKNRNLWNERGDTTLSDRPLYKECGPTVEQLTRQGKTIQRAGIMTTAQNLRDIPDESDLLGIGESKYLTRSDVMIHPSRERQKCLIDDMGQRKIQAADLIGIYNETAVDYPRFKRQNIRESPFETKTVPKVFNNCTRARSAI